MYDILSGIWYSKVSGSWGVGAEYQYYYIQCGVMVLLVSCILGVHDVELLYTWYTTRESVA